MVPARGPKFDDQPVWIVEMRHRKLRRRLEIENHARYSGCSLGHSNAFQEFVADLVGEEPLALDARACAGEIKKNAIRILDAVRAIVNVAGDLDGNARGIGEGPMPDGRYFDRPGVCGCRRRDYHRYREPPLHKFKGFCSTSCPSHPRRPGRDSNRPPASPAARCSAASWLLLFRPTPYPRGKRSSGFQGTA